MKISVDYENFPLSRIGKNSVQILSYWKYTFTLRCWTEDKEECYELAVGGTAERIYKFDPFNPDDWVYAEIQSIVKIVV